MNIEFIRDYSLGKPFVTESFPFGDNTLVFKVHKKIFLLLSLDNNKTFNVKCEPEQAIVYRNKYLEVKPGYHMNKTHWNTVNFDGNLSDDLIFKMINDSYQLVFNRLPKKIHKTI